MTGILDNSEIDITCPKCSRITKKSVGWIKSNTQFTCACGTIITLDTSQFRREISKIDSAITDLQKTIKKLNK